MRKPASSYFFRRKPAVRTSRDRYGSWWRVASLSSFTTHERLRVEWMVFYYTVAKENATLTAHHFGISRKTLHKWLKRFEESKHNVESLADRSKVPHHKRNWEVTLAIVYWDNLKRHILTAVDHGTKIGYARMYKNKSSRSAADFLYRLRYLVNQPIENLQTDNGSEFAWEFEKATARLGIQRYFSRVKTPKDNPEIERFNQTLEYEWLYDSNLSLDPEEFNPRLTEWLVEYNFNRPHQSLGYLAPMEYIKKELAKIRSPVLPMWSASTRY